MPEFKTERDRPSRNARVEMTEDEFIAILRAGGVDIPKNATCLGIYTGLTSSSSVSISWEEFTDV